MLRKFVCSGCGDLVFEFDARPDAEAVCGACRGAGDGSAIRVCFPDEPAPPRPVPADAAPERVAP